MICWKCLHPESNSPHVEDPDCTCDGCCIARTVPDYIRVGLDRTTKTCADLIQENYRLRDELAELKRRNR